MPSMLMMHVTDPADDIRKEIGSLKDFEVMTNQVLLGVYRRPEKTKSGLLLADRTRDEDEHQGKACLVLKKGPQAFKDQDYFQGESVDVGDWVAVWVHEGRKISINGVLCRMVKDNEIRMKVPAPDLVF